MAETCSDVRKAWLLCGWKKDIIWPRRPDRTTRPRFPRKPRNRVEGDEGDEGDGVLG